jgi:osmoprotectant transport system substrate-binding protein
VQQLRRGLGRSLLFSLAWIWLGATFASAQSVVVGAKDFTEQQIVAEMTGQLLIAKGFVTRLRTGFSSPGLRVEQQSGLVDICWEYTGTSLVVFNDVSEPLDAEEGYARVKELDLRKDLVWLAPSKVNDTYALAMRSEEADRQGIRTISDLASRLRQGQRFRIAVNTEFLTRADGLMPLQRTYRFDLMPGDVVRMEAAAIYDLLRKDASVDIGLVFTTDGRVTAFNLRVLEDDRRFFPAYILAPVVRKSTLDRYPVLTELLNRLSARLDSHTMAKLNAMVDLDGRPAGEVAASFLRTAGLL